MFDLVVARLRVLRGRGVLIIALGLQCRRFVSSSALKSALVLQTVCAGNNEELHGLAFQTQR